MDLVISHLLFGDDRLLFLKATISCDENVTNLLDTHENILG